MISSPVDLCSPGSGASFPPFFCFHFGALELSQSSPPLQLAHTSTDLPVLWVSSSTLPHSGTWLKYANCQFQELSSDIHFMIRSSFSRMTWCSLLSMSSWGVLDSPLFWETTDFPSQHSRPSKFCQHWLPDLSHLVLLFLPWCIDLFQILGLVVLHPRSSCAAHAEIPSGGRPSPHSPWLLSPSYSSPCPIFINWQLALSSGLSEGSSLLIFLYSCVVFFNGAQLFV